VDGDERQFVNRNDASDVLYDIRRPILAALLNVSHSASALENATQIPIPSSPVERAARLIEHSTLAAEPTRNQDIRTRLVRALLDDTVLYFRDLNDDERAYLEEHRGYLLRQICEATGLIAEIRLEGIAMVDDTGDLTDIKLPAEGSDGHLTWLLAQWFAECLRDGGSAAVPISTVEEHVRGLIQVQHPELAIADTLLCLRSLRLIDLIDGAVIPLPACARYAATAAQRLRMARQEE
jgi:uncharacterized protein (TIGR02678 family)